MGWKDDLVGKTEYCSCGLSCLGQLTPVTPAPGDLSLWHPWASTHTKTQNLKSPPNTQIKSKQQSLFTTLVISALCFSSVFGPGCSSLRNALGLLSLSDALDLDMTRLLDEGADYTESHSSCAKGSFRP